MNQKMREDNSKKICPKCGILVSNLRRHRERNRCDLQHIRKTDKQLIKSFSEGKRKSFINLLGERRKALRMRKYSKKDDKDVQEERERKGSS